MKIILILFAICVLWEFPSLSAAKNVIKVKCSALEQDVNVIWNEFGALELSIPETSKAAIIKIIANKHALEDYECIAKIYNGSKLLGATRVTVRPDSASFTYENRGRILNNKLSKESMVTCQSAESTEPDVILDWNNKTYSPESRHTTIFGTFDMFNFVHNSETTYQCSGWSSSQIQCEVVIAATVLVKPPVVQLVPSQQAVAIDESGEVICQVIDGDGSEKIQWFKKGQDSPINSGKRGIIEFPAISREDVGQYVCVAENAAGRDTARFEITKLYGSNMMLLNSENLCHECHDP